MALNETICEVDLSADGKHCGYIQLPHSVHRSAYGWIPIPIASIRNGAGPSVLLMAGNHGDEYEGQVLLSNLIRELTPEQVAGQVIILPMANFPAAQAGTRTSPLDEGNLNRSFPGDPLGRPTRAIANFIEEVLLPGRDLLVDLHSGGSSLNYLPSMLAGRSDSAADAARQRALLAAMGLPYALTYPRDGQGPFSSSAAERKGVMAISTELGGAGRVTPDILALGRRGVLRLLDHVGLLRNLEVPAPEPTATRFLELRSEHYCFAREPGLFEPRAALGDAVEKDDLAGLIHHPETPEKAPTEVFFGADGLVLCERVPARVERGDCLFHLAE